MSNYVSNEVVTIDDRYPPWINDKIKNLIQSEKRLYKNYLKKNNQSGFRQGDSCINQLISITHEIYRSMDLGYEVRGLFLDISKAFDKV